MFVYFFFFFFFSSRRRHTRSCLVSWARRCVQETVFGECQSQFQMEKGEQELIRRLKQDDEKAFNGLFYHYHARVYNLAKRFLQSKEDAEEIVQIVFIAVWENRKQIDEDQSLSGYILTIARHWIFNTLRKNVYRQGYIDYLLGQDQTFNFKTEDIVYYNELNTLVNNLIDTLPPCTLR
eukprot:TRINITY_DN11516_c0_g1_i1.p3 TRINITY_DN11516_c0_g1~~TRINITY_DN11516_c0_g1_i1.p3  ORF type:complete len:179 (-),score=15.30 TRINITY_DN11516_c0_g1_i1:168-704(-)